jgi:hypothetical protein
MQLNRDIFGQRFDLSGAEFVSRRSHRSSIALPQRPVDASSHLLERMPRGFGWRGPWSAMTTTSEYGAAA